MARRVALRAAAVAACLLLAACSGGASDAKPSPTALAPIPSASEAAGPGVYGVGVTTLHLVDTSRPTTPNREAPGTPDRRFEVEVWYPAAATVASPEARDVPVDALGAPYPLIIFAHGFSSFRRQSTSYTQQLASHGYVVASPDFPQSRIDTPGGPRLTAVLDQPADVTFVINELLRLNGTRGDRLAGAIDASRIGMTGHSLGGLTTMLVAYGPSRDPRIKAAVAISPPGCLLPKQLGAGVDVPAMIVGGTREKIVDPKSIRQAYEAAPVPKYFVQIVGADHMRFADIDLADEQYSDAVDQASRGDSTADAVAITSALHADATTCLQRSDEPDAPISGERQRELLRTAAAPFFDAYLRGDAGAMRFLRETLPTLAGIRVESQGG